MRWVAAAAVGVMTGLVALVAGAVPAALLAAVGAAVTMFAAIALWDDPASEIARSGQRADEPRPIAAEELIEAIRDPLLITRGRLVTHANAAAHALLGEHVVDEDVVLAIRHPAAAARLTALPADAQPLTFAGLGGPDRRWELDVHTIDAQRRIVRLTDRTATHAAERMRVDFVANASHELRTPLATLLGFIETLEEADAVGDQATRARFLGIMAGEARRMQRLIDDLMSLSRIEADRHVPPRESVALGPLLEEVRRASFTGASADADRIDTEVAPDLPEIIGDRAQLSQLLHNLVGNAVKYGGRTERVTVAAARDADQVRLTVRDRGDGIAPEHLPRLTERFYRVDPGRSRAMGGTGLGLAIVKHIVERHRGRLDIASVPGSGTIVTVRLPVAVTKASSNGHADGAPVK